MTTRRIWYDTSHLKESSRLRGKDKQSEFSPEVSDFEVMLLSSINASTLAKGRKTMTLKREGVVAQGGEESRTASRQLGWRVKRPGGRRGSGEGGGG